MLGAGRESREREEALRLRAISREAEIERIKAQIHPHFLFNCLGAIHSLIGTNPESARHGLMHLSRLLRNSLDTSEEPMIPLEREFQIVTDFLKLQQMRFEEGLKVECRIFPNAASHPVPPMVLQPLVENAVIHGREGGDTRVVVMAVANERGLTIKVENTVDEEFVGATRTMVRGGRPAGRPHADRKSVARESLPDISFGYAGLGDGNLEGRTVMNILVIDDEAPARRGLKEILGKLGVSRVREAGTIAQAVKAIEEERPDVLLLDIHMPGGGGFKLLEKLPARGIPVIFVTAHVEHAAKAFDVEAMDYVLKPVEPKRLLRSLEKVMSQAEEQRGTRSEAGLEDRIFLREGVRHHNVRIGDIELLEACGAYTKVVTGKNSMTVWGTLASLEARLAAGLLLPRRPQERDQSRTRHGDQRQPDQQPRDRAPPARPQDRTLAQAKRRPAQNQTQATKMKRTAKTTRQRKRPETVVDPDENIFNPFAPLLSYFRRRNRRGEGKRPRSFRHDFIFVLLLHVFAILAFFAHGSIKRYHASQQSKPATAKKEFPSVVGQIVNKNPEYEPLPSMDAKPGQPPLQAIREPDPFKPKANSAKSPATLARAEAPVAPNKTPAKQAAVTTQKPDKTKVQTPTPTAAAPAEATASAYRAARPTGTAREEEKKRLFLEATGRLEPTPAPRAEAQTPPEPEIRRAEPVPRAPAPRPYVPESPGPTEPEGVLQPFGGVAWSTAPTTHAASAAPGRATAANGKTGATRYTVAPGDNLEVIARRLEVDYYALASANNLSNSRDLRVGQTLVVPGQNSPM